ncbi:MAG TPA: hypothetical protein VGB37_03135 [Candidatus Lokiarchaeia archaeon]
MKNIESNKWQIRHPGTSEWIFCDSFKQAYEWFEGFNMPRLIINGKMESIELSIQRIENFLNKKGLTNKNR